MIITIEYARQQDSVQPKRIFRSKNFIGRALRSSDYHNVQCTTKRVRPVFLLFWSAKHLFITCCVLCPDFCCCCCCCLLAVNIRRVAHSSSFFLLVLGHSTLHVIGIHLQTPHSSFSGSSCSCRCNGVISFLFFGLLDGPQTGCRCLKTK